MILLCLLIQTFVLIAASTTISDKNGTSCTPQVYPIPSGFTTRDTFQAKVRSPGGTWKHLDSWQVNLAETNITSGAGNTHLSSVGYFDFCGDVEVSLTYNKSSIDSVRIRPLSYDIVPTVSGSEITFRLSRPRNIVIEVNGDIFDCLHLLSNTPDFDAPKGNSSDVIYLGPGAHSFPGGSINITSGQTLYLAGGAVLNSTVNFYRAKDAAIRGRGILYHPPSGGVYSREFFQHPYRGS